MISWQAPPACTTHRKRAARLLHAEHAYADPAGTLSLRVAGCHAAGRTVHCLRAVCFFLSGQTRVFTHVQTLLRTPPSESLSHSITSTPQEPRASFDQVLHECFSFPKRLHELCDGPYETETR